MINYNYYRNVTWEFTDMIKTFADKVTEKIWNREVVTKYPMDLLKKARRKLGFVNDAAELKDLQIPPGNKLRKMKGEWKDYHRINVDQQYRIKFLWDGGDAYEVEFSDDHDDL